MAALTAFTPAVTGVVDAGAAVSASDTIDSVTLGSRGALLEIINGNASSDTVTISDFGSTPAGNPLPSNQISKSVATATSQVFLVRPTQVNPATGLVTITHSVTATVTCKLYALSGL